MSELLYQYIDLRNEIQFRAEAQERGDECWVRLDVANRHIERLLNNQLKLVAGVAAEIERNLSETDEWLESKPQP